MIVVGTDTSERLVTVGDEHATLVFGTPRSGKTRGIVIPSLLAHQGPALVTGQAEKRRRAADMIVDRLRHGRPAVGHQGRQTPAQGLRQIDDR